MHPNARVSIGDLIFQPSISKLPILVKVYWISFSISLSRA